MAQKHLLVVALLAAVLHAACSAAATTLPANSSTVDAAATAYDVLAMNKLPRGLLPKGVQSYAVHPGGSAEAVEVTLAGECNFPVTVGGRPYKMRFGREVGGVIRPGSIHEVYGVRVQFTFRWLGISAVDRAGDKLVFTVEDTSPLSFPVSNFAVSPSCH